MKKIKWYFLQLKFLKKVQRDRTRGGARILVQMIKIKKIKKNKK